MSRVCWYVYLLIIILPSTLYAEISSEIREKLIEATKTSRGDDYEVYDIYEVGAVVTPNYKTQESGTYLIYGKDSDRCRRGDWNVLSIGDNGEPIHRWSMGKSNNLVTINDRNLTLKISETDGNSSAPLECTFTFLDADDYKRFKGRFPFRRARN